MAVFTALTKVVEENDPILFIWKVVSTTSQYCYCMNFEFPMFSYLFNVSTSPCAKSPRIFVGTCSHAPNRAEAFPSCAKNESASESVPVPAVRLPASGLIGLHRAAGGRPSSPVACEEGSNTLPSRPMDSLRDAGLISEQPTKDRLICGLINKTNCLSEAYWAS